MKRERSKKGKKRNSLPLFVIELAACQVVDYAYRHRLTLDTQAKFNELFAHLSAPWPEVLLENLKTFIECTQQAKRCANILWTLSIFREVSGMKTSTALSTTMN